MLRMLGEKTGKNNNTEKLVMVEVMVNVSFNVLQ